MVAIPPALLEILQLGSGSAVNMVVDSGRLLIEPELKKKYSLQELLAQCDPSAPMSIEDKDWVSSRAIGEELV